MWVRRAFLPVLAILLLVASVSVFAQEADKVQCYSTWDENYFFFAAQVSCSDVESTHVLPNADTAGDDSVTVYIESDGARGTSLTPRCFSMTVTAGGGAEFKAGTDAGNLERVKVTTFKYGVNLQGTINNNDDSDIGYSVEMALPWSILNTKPPLSNEKMGYNIVARRHGDKPGDFVSLAPGVTTEADILSPTKWSSIVFGPYSFVAATSGVDKILSIRYIARVPLIDGTLAEKEWHKNTSASFAFPNIEGPAPEIKFAPHKQVFAIYDMGSQCDHKRQAAFTDCLSQGSRLADFPPFNAGPWYSSDRVQWHKEMLADMSSARVDVALTVIKSDAGLRQMVAAIREMAVEGQSAPQAAPCVDVGSLAQNENKSAALADLLESFYSIVPPELRAIAQTGPPNPGHVAYPVFLTAAVPQAALDECGKLLQASLGKPIVWLGPYDAEGCDGRFQRAGANGGKSFGDMRIRTGIVSPGFDNTGLVAAESAEINARMGGNRYDNAWQNALRIGPHWIILDSWNSYANGTELAESRQYGKLYIDKTRDNVGKFRASREYDVVYSRADAPDVVEPGNIALAEFALTNVGTKAWAASDGLALGYRWYKDNRYFGESKVRMPIARDVAPGASVNVNVGIATVDMQDAALAEGDYVVRFEMVRLRDGKWLSTQGAQPFWYPLTVGKPEPKGASYLQCSIPTIMATGKAYPASVTVRNDTADTWVKGVAKLGMWLYSGTPGGGYTTKRTSLAATEVLLVKDCKPGEVVQVRFQIAIPSLPESEIGQKLSSHLFLNINDGNRWLGPAATTTVDLSAGSTARPEGSSEFTPQIVASDNTARLVISNLPAKVQAGKDAAVKIVLRNTGKTDWKAKQTFVGYHLYHLDGSELLWEGTKTPLKIDLPAGMPGVVSAVFTPPTYDGKYVVVWDVYSNDTWLSTLPLTRGNDQLLNVVEVTGGKLVFLDFGAMADVPMSSPEAEPTSGDFDGKGMSFPGEWVPPESAQGVTALAPSEYNLVSEPRPDGRISFLCNVKEPFLAGAVRGNGQRLDIPKGKYVAIHVLAASIDGPTQGVFSLLYGDNSVDASVEVSDWGSAPKEGEVVGLFAGHRRGAEGDDASKTCRLFHYKLVVDSATDLTGLVLPKNAALRVAAVTVEKAQ